MPPLLDNKNPTAKSVFENIRTGPSRGYRAQSASGGAEGLRGGGRRSRRRHRKGEAAGDVIISGRSSQTCYSSDVLAGNNADRLVVLSHC